MAWQVFVHHVNQTLLCLLQAGQYVTPILVVALSIGEHLLHVGEELLHRAVIATRALALHSLEVHGVADDLKVVFSFLRGHWLPEGPAEAVLDQLAEDFLTLLQLKVLATRCPLCLKDLPTQSVLVKRGNCYRLRSSANSPEAKGASS